MDDRRKGPLVLRRAALVLATALGIAAIAAPAHAITNGTADGNDHPNVGGLVAPQAYSDGTWIYCSATLISPTVVLTAAHCDEGGDERVRITFATAYQDGDPVYAGTFQGDPLFGKQQSDPHDIAVVVLDQPVTSITPAPLPAAGSLGSLRAGQPVTSVGYGAYEVAKAQGAGGHTFRYDDVRNQAVGSLNAVTPSWLRVSMNPATGNGGTCYGDSGGPNFLGSTTTLAAITITGDYVCRATNVTYRLDTPSARSFLAPYVTLP
jgi:secreted trypsin-like serine protease